MVGIGGRQAQVGLAPRTCEVCGSEYQPYRANQRTCSAKCREGRTDARNKQVQYRQRPDVRERKNAARRIANNPNRVAINRRRALQRYGLTTEQHDEMLAAQNGRCAVCGALPDPEGKGPASRLHVDHDHTTGVHRELLCCNCNQGIGHFGDDPDRMRAAAAYIERHRKD